MRKMTSYITCKLLLRFWPCCPRQAPFAHCRRKMSLPKLDMKWIRPGLSRFRIIGHPHDWAGFARIPKTTFSSWIAAIFKIRKSWWRHKSLQSSNWTLTAMS